MYTTDDLYNQGKEILAQGTQVLTAIKAVAAGQPPLPVPTSGPISIAQANQEIGANSNLTYLFDGKSFLFSLKTPFGPMNYTTAWNQQL